MTDPSTVTAFLYACIDDDEHAATSELGSPRPPESPHAARWTPAHVLAELAVKRELLADVEIELTRTDQPRLPYLARLLAHPYRDRPGFQEEWALPPPGASAPSGTGASSSPPAEARPCPASSSAP